MTCYKEVEVEVDNQIIKDNNWELKCNTYSAMI